MRCLPIQLERRAKIRARREIRGGFWERVRFCRPWTQLLEEPFGLGDAASVPPWNAGSPDVCLATWLFLEMFGP